MPDQALVQAFEGRRVRIETPRRFEDVVASLRRLVPRSIPFSGYPAAMEKAGGLDLASFERVVRSLVGESGFMLFFEIDHGAWLPFYGIQRKVVRWILGNPTLAITMMRHDVTAGLFAPVELLLIDRPEGEGSTILYVEPSSLMVVGEQPALREAALALDGSLRRLVESAAKGDEQP